MRNSTLNIICKKIYTWAFVFTFLYSSALIASEVCESGTLTGISAKQRFELVQKYLIEHPDTTMKTDIGDWIRDNLYASDLAFIRQEIAKRPNASALMRQIDCFDDLTREKYLGTFMDYNFVAQNWARILSDKNYTSEFLQRLVQGYDEIRTRYVTQNITALGISDKFHFMSAPGIIIPHISDTGEIPALTMNAGFGFFVGGFRPCSIDFLAVATKQNITFDYFTKEDKQTSLDGWLHDYEHLQLAQRLGPQPRYYNHTARTANIAVIRNRINQIPDTKERAQAELAFIMLFHESQKPVIDNMETELNDRIEVAEYRYNNTVPTSGFNSIPQYHSYVALARSLNITIAENDIIQEYREMLINLLSGYRVLLRYAADYDRFYLANQEKPAAEIYAICRDLLSSAT